MSKLIERKERFEERLEGRNRMLWDILVFLLRFTVLAAPLYILLWTSWNPVWLRSLEAGITHQVLQLAGVSSQHQGTVVTTRTLSVDVSTDSTGWKSVLALAALIIAVRGYTWRERLSGIMAGTVILFTANIARLASMIYAVEVWNISYQLIHLFLWRWGLTAVVLATWLVWLHWTDQQEDERSPI
ncbi:MAG: exosortase/archaeosortase family protein [Candidatus Nanohaloarchaea archaeon]|nr:exosortase/archaeosortase family protein [Candidatus Nanohaloarchaea archaeon]